MILYIDTSNAEIMTVALGEDGKAVAKRSLKAKYKQAEKLLPAIDMLLKKSIPRTTFRTRKVVRGKVHRTLDLKGIVVVNGPGPFTALRIGVATANALGYCFKIPVVGIKSTEFNNLDEMIKEGEKRIKKVENKRSKHSIGSAWSAKQNIVEPEYGQEPNITIKK